MGCACGVIVLDTHIWLWWLHAPEKLSPTARSLIETLIDQRQSQNALRVSVISLWEIAVKVQLGKLSLPMDIYQWFEGAQRYPGVMIEPLTPLDAILSTQLPGSFHKDPADRIIVSLARRYGIPLVTCDRNILDYPHVETVW